MTFNTVPLRRVARLVNGGTPTAGVDFWDGDVPWATPTDLARVDGGSIASTERTLTEEGLRVGSASVPRGSLILSTRAPIGYVALVDAPEMAFNQGCRGVVPNDKVLPEYLQFWLLCQVQPLQALGTGSTFVELSTPALQAFRVPLPSLEDQEKIVRFVRSQVSLIDGAVALRRRQLRLLREHSTATEQHLVWRGLKDSLMAEVPMQQVGLVPAHWRRVRNKNLLAEARHLSSDGSEELLSVSHITGVTRRADKNVNMFLAESNEGYVKVRPGDLVINTMWAWMGALGVSPLEGIVSPAYGVYRPRSVEDFVPDYFDALYRSPAYVSEMTRYSTGVWSSRLRIYPEVFLSLPVVAPPAEEQRAIAKRIREVRDAIVPAAALLEQSIALLQERKSALITAAVSGQLDPSTMSDRAGKVAIA